MKFDEFLHYVADNKGEFDGNSCVHWTSFLILCNPCEVQYKYIAKLETMNGDFGKIMDAINATIVHLVNKTLGPNSAESKTKDPQEKLNRYYSQVDNRTITILKKLFIAEFELLGYDNDFKKV